MGVINVLSFEVANLIAAGEVVDRPGSAIKELIENSIDAGAGRIAVEIQRGGVLFMRVTDNGRGMAPDDLAVCVRRHATSKIKDASDLNAIITLGFRGEALAAISAVSDVRIITKQKGSVMGSAIEVHSGRAGAVTEQGAADGTTVIVENLFANVPARLKFLKRDQTEAQYAAAVVEKVAMSHPEIAFRFISDGNLKLSTPGDGNLQSVIRAVYGKDYATKMIAVNSVSGGVKAEGFITAPDVPRANRNFQNFFINGRYVKSKTCSAAVEQAYSSYIPPEKFPGCVIKLELNPGFVDVNVHPSKLEVKFYDERPVFDAVYRAVRDALLCNTVRPGDEKQDEGRNFAAAAANPFEAARSARTTVGGAFVPVRDAKDGKGDSPVQLGIEDARAEARPVSSAERDRYRTPVTGIGTYTSREPELGGYRVPAAAGRPAAPAVQPSAPSGPTEDDRRTAEKIAAEYAAFAAARAAGRTDSAPAPYEAAGQAEAEPDVPAQTEDIPGTGKEAAADTEPVLRRYRIAGEIFNSYIIVEEGDKVTVFDKHAAHERLNFEKMKKRLHGAEHAVTYLAVPLELTLSGEEINALEENRADIEKIGFEYSSCGKTLKINGIPMDLSPEASSCLFENFAQALVSGTGNVETLGETAFEKALYQASCKASIKAGRVYPEGYTEQLVKELMENPEVTYCPHGRPVAFTLSKYEIDHKYKRN